MLAGASPGHHEEGAEGEEPGSKGDGWAGVGAVSPDDSAGDWGSTAAKGEDEGVVAWGVTGVKGVSRDGSLEGPASLTGETGTKTSSGEEEAGDAGDTGVKGLSRVAASCG